MKSQNERKPAQPEPAVQVPATASKKRFRIEKLEERIAPRKAGGRHIVPPGHSSATDLIPPNGLYY